MKRSPEGKKSNKEEEEKKRHYGFTKSTVAFAPSAPWGSAAWRRRCNAHYTACAAETERCKQKTGCPPETWPPGPEFLARGTVCRP